jgi:shikimate kinase
MLEGHGISIWLDCPFETISTRVMEGDSRPLARDPVRFRKLYDDRRAAYALANFRIDVNCEVERAVDSILALPCWK